MAIDHLVENYKGGKTAYSRVMIRHIVRNAVKEAIARDGVGFIKSAYFNVARSQQEE